MLSERPWKPEAVLRLLLGMFIGLAFIMLNAGLIRQFTGEKLTEGSPLFLIISTLSLDGTILVSVFIFLRIEHITWAEAFGFNNPGLVRTLMWGVIFAICFLPVGLLLRIACDATLNSLQVQTHDQEAVQTLKNASPGLMRIYLAFFAVIIAPLAEETLFRGILYPAIKQWGFPRAALWGTSFLFALIHLDVATFLPLMVLALGLAWLYEKTDNLLACITAHGLFNAANVAFLYAHFPGNQPPY